jgi:hypothetical protein
MYVLLLYNILLYNFYCVVVFTTKYVCTKEKIAKNKIYNYQNKVSIQLLLPPFRLVLFLHQFPIFQISLVL